MMYEEHWDFERNSYKDSYHMKMFFENLTIVKY